MSLTLPAPGWLAETGRPYTPPAGGEMVTGIYQRPLTLNSGLFAVIDDGQSLSFRNLTYGAFRVPDSSMTARATLVTVEIDRSPARLVALASTSAWSMISSRCTLRFPTRLPPGPAPCPDDIIAHLDDEPAQGMSLRQAIGRMRGPVKSPPREKRRMNGTGRQRGFFAGYMRLIKSIDQVDKWTGGLLVIFFLLLYLSPDGSVFGKVGLVGILAVVVIAVVRWMRGGNESPLPEEDRDSENPH